MICPTSQAKVPATNWHDGQISRLRQLRVKNDLRHVANAAEIFFSLPRVPRGRDEMRRQGAIGPRGRVASNHDLAGESFEMQRARQPVGNAVASSDAVALKVIRAASLTPFRRPWPDCARKAQSGLAVCARRGLRDTAGGYLIVRETLSFKGRGFKSARHFRRVGKTSCGARSTLFYFHSLSVC